MSAPSPPPAFTPPRGAPGYRVPSLGYRILVAALRLIPAFFLLIILPVAALTFVNAHGIALPISTLAVSEWGIALIALGAARYILRPTRAFGPVSIVASGVALLYLLYAVSLSPYRLTIPGGSASIAAGYALFLELMMIIPAIGILVGALVTVEDATGHTERLVFDFPA
ncbi:MAG: hypothetical protein ACLP8Y_08270 [Thermoplasmata archaeon]